MNKEEIETGNKLIIDFLNWKIYTYNGPYMTFKCYKVNSYPDIYIPESGILPANPSNLKFHSSWDWLMPVVEKIENLEDYIIEISYKQCIIKSYEKNMEIITSRYLDSKIEAVWASVVEFIRWYNEQGV